MKSVIVGTAGHIDHGKTALVKALTGIDADRLEEEKRRGITIDIGFAHLELEAPSGESLRLGFVDVPGHERFVRNMLAGIGGIDLVLFVVAADEGIKPQTREHFDICRLLHVQRGICVLTKSDLVDADSLQVVKLEMAEFLRGSFLDTATAPMVAVSSRSGDGMEPLKRELARLAATTQAKDSAAYFRLPIDRVFSMKGHGTVVTGTLISGSVQKEAEVEIFPQRIGARIRGVQVHGQPAERAVAGERTALNLAGNRVSTEALARGMVLAEPGVFEPVQRLDVALSLLPGSKPLRNRARVHLHAYTFECIAIAVLHEGKSEIRPGESGFAQLRLADATLLLPGDRFILRQFSPLVTIGGGMVIDAAPLKQAPEALRAFLKILSSGSPEQILQARIARRADAGLPLQQA
ncbi:MAG: selenocysteine-specific translation elongation factor, partial [Steroidobacteraceae bacterium]